MLKQIPKAVLDQHFCLYETDIHVICVKAMYEMNKTCYNNLIARTIINLRKFFLQTKIHFFST